jgi:hypothetical protein
MLDQMIIQMKYLDCYWDLNTPTVIVKISRWPKLLVK